MRYFYTLRCPAPFLLTHCKPSRNRVIIAKVIDKSLGARFLWPTVYFLKQLKRSSVEPEDLFHFYVTVIRPVLEYACPVWHSDLTIEHRNRIEAIQKRVFRIIFGASDYLDFCITNGYSALHERRDLLSRQFLPARRYASAGYSDRNVSVRLSVRHAPVLCQNEES